MKELAGSRAISSIGRTPSRRFVLQLPNSINVAAESYSNKLLAYLIGIVGALLLPVAVYANSPPIIDSLIASPQVVAPEGEVTLEVHAHDPDCGDVCSSGCGQYLRPDLTTWTVSAGFIISEANGVGASPYIASVLWQAPAEEGVYEIELSLADSGSWMCGGRQTITGTVFVQVLSEPNQAPVIEEVTAAPSQLYPDQLSELSCFASDLDGHALSYQWSADHGTVVPGTGADATFFASSPGLATLVCEVTDELGAKGIGSVAVSVSGAHAHQTFLNGLVTPQRVSVNSKGDIFVADRGSGGITILRLENGAFSHRISAPHVIAVAVDWEDNLLVGETSGARILDPSGSEILELDSEYLIGEVSAVAVDMVRRRYAVLSRRFARVTVFDETGEQISSFGSVGDESDQLRSPLGLATTPNGAFVVADTGHHQIKVFDLEGHVILSFGGPGGAIGEFMQLSDVAVDEQGLIYASDRYQDWVQVFLPDGQPLEVIGTYGEKLGQFKSPAGLALAPGFQRLIVASVNSSRLEIFKTSAAPVIDWPAPEATISVDHLSFDEQAVGTTSSPMQVDVTNSGSAILGLSEVSIQGPFDLTNGCDYGVAPGDSCSLSVRFIAAGRGWQSGELLINTAVGDFPVMLSGYSVVPPRALAAPGFLGFPGQDVGTVSNESTVVLANAGTAPMEIQGLEINGDFLLNSNCPEVLGGSGSCQVQVSFLPTDRGDRNGSLVINSNSIDGPITIPLSGRGIEMELTIDPPHLDFGEVLLGESWWGTVTVHNSGTETFAVVFSGIDGANPADFSVSEDGCGGLSLAAGDMCEIQVEFAPKDAGSRSAEFEVLGSFGLQSTITLYGTGDADLIFADGFESGNLLNWTSGKRLNVFPEVFDFGNPKLGAIAETLTLRITNHSGSVVYLDNLALIDDPDVNFMIIRDGCSWATLQPGNECVVMMTMRTLNEGSVSARVMIPNSLESAEAQLHGTVVWP